MGTNRLSDYPSLLKQQESLLAHLFQAEAMVEILLGKDLADCLHNKQYLYEYFCVLGNLLDEAKTCSEELTSQLINSVACKTAAEKEI
jgi:hypothetical protein